MVVHGTNLVKKHFSCTVNASVPKPNRLPSPFNYVTGFGAMSLSNKFNED